MEIKINLTAKSYVTQKNVRNIQPYLMTFNISHNFTVSHSNLLWGITAITCYYLSCTTNCNVLYNTHERELHLSMGMYSLDGKQRVIFIFFE